MSFRAVLVFSLICALAACGPSSSDEDGGQGGIGGVGGGDGSGGAGGTGGTGGAGGAGGTGGTGGAGGGGSTAVCTTRITYGSAWLRPAGHAADFDDVLGNVTWDGSCSVDGSGNSFASLSNGFKPYFAGKGSCVLSLEHDASCTPAPGSCATRVSYGASWSRAPNHPDDFDDVGGAVTWDGVCHPAGSQSWALLSNGWTPYFSGSSCELSFRHTECGGLFANPVVATDCADPGVVKTGNSYLMACTSGNAADPFPLRSSNDLVRWQSRGTIFSAATKPTWAASDFWAPEIHRVGSTWVAYFSARHKSGDLAIGAATATSPTGPYTDSGAPLVRDPNPGVIDAHQFTSSSGQPYLLWKVDGNASGINTPIKIQPLNADGTALTGSPTTLISNTLVWEGTLVEGPWMIERGGFFYLFYSGNFYASAAYAVGVARATSPTGPFTKAAAPILVSKGQWAGPGHGSIVVGPSGDWVHVFHAWVAGKIQQAPGRQALVERVTFENGWPVMRGGPSSRSQPMP